MFEEWKFVIGPDGYKGSVKAILIDGVSCYTGMTAEDYEAEGCTVVKNEELDRLIAAWEQEITGDWKEITAEQYEYALNVLPPLQWYDGGFFCSEAFSGSLYDFYQELDGKYYASLQSVYTPRDEILNDLMK